MVEPVYPAQHRIFNFIKIIPGLMLRMMNDIGINKAVYGFCQCIVKGGVNTAHG